MKSTLKLQVVVPSDHRLEIVLPDEVPAGPAEVIVVTEERRSPRQTPLPAKRRDLSDIAGTWVEDPEITQAFEDQRRIDPDLWR